MESKFKHMELRSPMVTPCQVIILGSPLSGKSTLCSFMQEHFAVPVYELDNELTRLGGGVFPKYQSLREGVLMHRACCSVLNLPHYIFFTSCIDLHLLKSHVIDGVKIFQLQVDLQELLRRNHQRMVQNGCDDGTQFIQQNKVFQNILINLDIVSYQICAMRPTEEVCADIYKRYMGL